ncbi:TPA: 2-oxoacid:acceptor oxidoreductase subunit alpha [Candidatus Woesearchaeota archaeon]|nr:2-oxoacid:acceptor oxidoreductase subunit alpha [Candidatus Woesearchaeota archaeon]
MTFTVIVGGKAGYGVKKAASTVAKIFSERALHVFEMDDYPSVIKGSHNFSVISCDSRPITSHYQKAQLIVALDKRSYDAHISDLAEDGILIHDSGSGPEGVALPISEEAKQSSKPELITGVAAITVLCAAVGMSKEELLAIIEKEYARGVEENKAYAEKMYDHAMPKIGGKFRLPEGDGKQRRLATGNEMIGLGAAAAGLDMYIAYPMTPSTSILHMLAEKADSLGIEVVQAESELAVANMAIGAVFTGAKTAVGTSGGGFCLMQEAFSLAGISEAPVLFVMVSRPGPATGVPTYTSQGDLKWIRHPGHGEFPRIVAAPGSVEECFYLAAELMWLAWNFQNPTVLLSDKHLSESTNTVQIQPEKARWAVEIPHDQHEGYKRYAIREDGISPLQFPPSKEMIKWTSYEHDERGITTEDAEMVRKMAEKRSRKGKNIIEHLKHNKTVNRYGESRSGKIIVTYGSTTMSVLEALKASGIEDVQVVQPIYVEPFPAWELKDLKGKELVAVELDENEQFADLFRSRGLDLKAVIKRYDGRPFDPKELAEKLKEVFR